MDSLMERDANVDCLHCYWRFCLQSIVPISSWTSEQKQTVESAEVGSYLEQAPCLPQGRNLDDS